MEILTSPCCMSKVSNYPFLQQKQKKKIGNLGIQYVDVKIRQYSKVTYSGCELDESLSGEVMVLNVIHKINDRLKLLYRKNRYSTPYLKQFLCNALIQPHFDYASSACYPNLKKSSKANCKLFMINLLDTVSR